MHCLSFTVLAINYMIHLIHSITVPLQNNTVEHITRTLTTVYILKQCVGLSTEKIKLNSTYLQCKPF